MRLTHFSADVLSILPPSPGSPQAAALSVKTHTTKSASVSVGPGNGAPMQYIAKLSAWPLLSEPLCFQVSQIYLLLLLYYDIVHLIL